MPSLSSSDPNGFTGLDKPYNKMAKLVNGEKNGEFVIYYFYLCKQRLNYMDRVFIFCQKVSEMFFLIPLKVLNIALEIIPHFVEEPGTLPIHPLPS